MLVKHKKMFLTFKSCSSVQCTGSKKCTQFSVPFYSVGITLNVDHSICISNGQNVANPYNVSRRFRIQRLKSAGPRKAHLSRSPITRSPFPWYAALPPRDHRHFFLDRSVVTPSLARAILRLNK